METPMQHVLSLLLPQLRGDRQRTMGFDRFEGVVAAGTLQQGASEEDEATLRHVLQPSALSMAAAPSKPRQHPVQGYGA